MSSPATSTGATNGSGPTVTLLENLPDAIVLMDEGGTVQPVSSLRAATAG